MGSYSQSQLKMVETRGLRGEVFPQGSWLGKQHIQASNSVQWGILQANYRCCHIQCRSVKAEKRNYPVGAILLFPCEHVHSFNWCYWSPLHTSRCARCWECSQWCPLAEHEFLGSQDVCTQCATGSCNEQASNNLPALTYTPHLGSISCLPTNCRLG